MFGKNKGQQLYKVLIVDDEPFIRQGLSIIIKWEDYGYTIGNMAENGLDAVEILKKEKYDLIIVDIRMPKMDGLSFIKYIRQNKISDAEVVLLSGYYEFEYAKEAIRYSVGDYILKPVQKDELVKLLDELKRKIDNKKRKEKESNNMSFERNLRPIIWGKYDAINLSEVKKYMKYTENLRYINIELSPYDDEFNKLSDSNKRSIQRELYNICKNNLKGSENLNVVWDVNEDEISYSIGFIYAQGFADEKNISEKEYIESFASLFDNFKYQILFHVGKKVNLLNDLSKSFKSACIINFVDKFRDDKRKVISIYEEDEVKNKPQDYMIDTNMINAFIRNVEENDLDAIKNSFEEIYDKMIEYNMDFNIINICINYILGRFLQLAKEQDEGVDQEEIMEYIRKGAITKFARKGSREQFIQFAQEYSDYLSQLRKNASRGIIGNIVKDIENSYMDNLSLKEFGEKYFINSAYLGQLFKKKFGQSFKEYLNNYRIEKACELLIKTDKKVYMVAEEVGYHNIDYFINKFVIAKGKTPHQYRKDYYR